MRSNAPVGMPVALTVAGSDSGGGAGIQADLQTMASHGVFGTSVVTAVTAQNTRGVTGSHVLPAEEVRAQADAVFDDFAVGAVKTGMLATAPVIETVTERLAGVAAPAVVDPVMVAASGDRLLEPEAEAAYEELIAEAALVTPNADEAAVLTDVQPTDAESARRAGEAVLEFGAEAALIKGGHVEGDPVRDVLVTESGTTTFEHPRIDTDATHGSGCALSAAIAALLARDAELESAVETATEFLADAVRYSYDVGEGPGAVNHLVGLRDRAAREPTAEAVHDVVDALVNADARPLVPEVGTNVAGATPHAEAVDDVAAVEGRITQTLDGVAPNRGVRFGASSHVARALLGAREVDADLRFALNCRLDDDVERAIGALDWSVAEVERDVQAVDAGGDDGEAGGDVGDASGDVGDAGDGAVGTDDGAVDADDGADEAVADADATQQALQRAADTPVAVVDRGGLGTEPSCRLLASDAQTLTDRALALLDAVRADEER